jgi:glycosyltransferase involved in cell wall biosynthesis
MSKLNIKSILSKLIPKEYLKRSKLFKKLICRIFPSFKARIELNKGNINKPFQALNRSIFANINNSKIYRRLSFMNQVINGQSPFKPSVNRTYKTYNGRVIQVFHSCETYHQNGYAIRSKHILDSLKNIGIHTTNVTRLGYPWDFNQFAAAAICEISKPDKIEYRHKHCPERLLADSDLLYIKKYADYLSKLITEKNHSVIHAHSNYLNGIASALAAEKTNIPSIYEMRGLWHITRCSKDPEFKGSDLFQYQEKMEIQAATMSDTVITLSEALKSWLISKGIPESKISIVPNAANIVARQIKPKNNDNFVIGYIGSITEYEGLDLVLMAADKLRHRIDNLQVTIIGEGSYKKHLIGLANKLQLNNIVNFVGRVNHKDVPEYYAQMDVCPIFRKDYDVCKLVPPLKPLEIMSYGKAIIVSDLAPLKEIIDSEVDGLVCRNGDIDELALSLATLYNDKELRTRLGENALKKILSTYNWSNNANLYNNIYSSKSI